MQLSDSQRKFLIQDQAIGSGIFNLLLNALIAWLTFRKLPAVPISGDPSITGDVIGTMILLPLLTCVIVTPLVRKAVQAGKVEPLHEDTSARRMVRWLPSNSFLRGLALGFISLALFGPLLLGAFMVAGVQTMSVGGYVFIKALYAAALAAVNAPVIALYVLAKEQAPARGHDALRAETRAT